jgi:tetraacyldisaccharide-1-P 4'-kinase
LGLRLRAVLTHPDHHPFTAEELSHATSFGLPVVTTEKDLTRLPPHPALWAIRLELRLTSGEDALMERIDALLGRRG